MTTFAHNGNGKLVKGPGGKLAKDCECCCPATCSGTDGIGWRIAGYVGGLFDLTGCSAYTFLAKTSPVWPGTFPEALNNTNICYWTPGTGVDLSISGKAAFGRNPRILVGCESTLLEIYLRLFDGGQLLVWQGENVGTTIDGTYTKIAGCAGPSALSVEENT